MFGSGYAWNVSYLNISIGDTVNWSWKPPLGISSVKYQIIQVKDATSTEPIGFKSDAPSSIGRFSYQFNKPGVYYYWSGYVESTGSIDFRGIVHVGSSSDKELTVDVSLNGFSGKFRF